MTSSRPLVVIQSICTIWTKASRGGTGASARNHTPEARELPACAFPFPGDVFLLHELVYTEHDHFQQPIERLEQKTRTDPYWYACLKLFLHENRLKVTVAWERSEGAPRRVAFPRKEFVLQEQQWARVAYNLRTSWEDGWTYKKHVFDIGFFSSISPGIFLETEPAHTYVDMAQLW